MVSSFRTIEGLQTRIDVPKCCFMFYFIRNGKNKSNVLYPYTFQTLIFKALYIFTIKTTTTTKI